MCHISLSWASAGNQTRTLKHALLLRCRLDGYAQQSAIHNASPQSCTFADDVDCSFCHNLCYPPMSSVVSTALGSHCKLPALQVIPATLAMMKGTLEDALESEAAWEQVINAHSLSCLGGQTENNRNPVIVGNQKPGSLKMVECKSDFCFKTVWPQHTPTAAAKSGTCQRCCS